MKNVSYVTKVGWLKPELSKKKTKMSSTQKASRLPQLYDRFLKYFDNSNKINTTN